MATIRTNTGRDITPLINQSKILGLIELSEMWHYPFERRKTKDEQFANCLIIDCSSDTWWYKDLVGIEVFCSVGFKLYFDGRKKVLTKAAPCIVYKKSIIEGRDFHPSDIIII